MSLPEKLDDILALVEVRAPLTPSASPGSFEQADKEHAECQKKLQKIMQQLQLQHKAEESARRNATGESGEEGEGVQDRFTGIMSMVDATKVKVALPASFKDLLLAKMKNGRVSKHEDDRFGQLFIGYYGTDALWVRVFVFYYGLAPGDNKPCAVQAKVLDLMWPAVCDWENICDESEANNNDKDILLYTHQFLHSQWVGETTSSFVGYVLRTVQVLKFTIAWTGLDGKAGGKAWKSEYIEAACKLTHADVYQQCKLAGNQTAHYKKLDKKVKELLKVFWKSHSHDVEA
ncbi:hypothetical protein H0H81_002699 [Sphagnurus paluster]|uniref:Uncharacterized protein n=1 Tax=Sphagnurus paluster TaxID=117069 RepID=A0A9P7GU55_9AGAR|nr:hypothetical protein H0H81_002699 [Sphagnurus paluster]